MAKEGDSSQWTTHGCHIPTEPVYEEPVKNHIQATELDTMIRIQQLQVTWPNRCKKIDVIGILCCEKPWEHCDQKVKGTAYWDIGSQNF